jgi:hypothetical protein
MRMNASFPELRTDRDGAERARPNGWERMVHLLLGETATEQERVTGHADFDEPFTGLHTREIDEPELFSRLFGGQAA